MQALPTELENVIQDMVCRKLHNNSPSRIGLIIVADVSFSTKIEGDLERALEGWVWDSLDSAHRALDFDAGWAFVSNVVRDQNIDDGYADYPEERENMYQVCVNIEPCAIMGKLPLFRYSGGYAIQSPVTPASVLEHFASPPVEVRGISVSGVDQDILRGQWEDCISKDPDSFDRAGQGYMQHPMWVLPDRAQDGTFLRLASVRERSFNFGWSGYPRE
jgi:hypothetical protein